MTEEVNVSTSGQAPQKRMSKGCLVAIIVSVVIVILICLVVYFVFLKKNQYVDYFAATQLDNSKIILVESNVQGIDTVYFNKIVDNFKIQLLSDTIFTKENQSEMRFVQIANVFTYTQLITNDSKLDSAEAQTLIDTLINKYPSIVPANVNEVDSLIMEPNL